MDFTHILPSPATPTRPRLPHRRSPHLAAKLSHLRLPLAPLVRLTTGEIHASFPATLLNYHLLTSEQLDDLAHFYHQRTPCEWTRHYPQPVEWSKWADIETKRRRLGRFIGLKGCESPEMKEGISEEREREIEREIERRRQREEDNEMVRKKARWY